MTSRNNAASRGVLPKASQSANQPPSISSSVSKKRKNSSQIKFYGVKLGHTPGVYLNWKECERNITGFKNASFKSFPTRDEAEAFVAGRERHTDSASAPGVEKYYGVARGRVPGVYTDWAAAQQQITGWKGPKYKKFGTRIEAEAFVRESYDTNINIVTPIGSTGITREVSLKDESVSEDDAEECPNPKKARTTLSSRETPQIGVFSEASKLKDKISDPSNLPTMENQTMALRIYTDGSSLGNGKNGARAGLGVWFGPADPRNVSERLLGSPQTNQRAELAAILRALEIVPLHRDVHIVTDSEYSINCLTKWYKNWERNNWHTSTGAPVLNQDLIRGILTKIGDREDMGTATIFRWVKGHSMDPGNEAADELAVRGAQLPHLD